MNTYQENFLARLKNNGYLWDMGQLTEETIKEFNKFIRKGFIEKKKMMWPHFYYGTVRKTVYFWVK